MQIRRGSRKTASLKSLGIVYKIYDLILMQRVLFHPRSISFFDEICQIKALIMSFFRLFF